MSDQFEASVVSQWSATEKDIRLGRGGGTSACCLALTDSCESEALRNLSREKRRCFDDSSWTGGVAGRERNSSSLLACPADSDASRSGSQIRGTEAMMVPFSPSSSLSWDVVVVVEVAVDSERRGSDGVVSTRPDCRRMSASLATLPRRRRRNGIAERGHQHCSPFVALERRLAGMHGGPVKEANQTRTPQALLLRPR